MVGCWPRPQQLKRPGGRLPSVAGVAGLPRLLNLPSIDITHATGVPVTAQKHAGVYNISLVRGTACCCICSSMGSKPAGCSTWEASPLDLDILS